MDIICYNSRGNIEEGVTKMKERNTSLDAMKGFAILLVMMGHVLILNEINDAYIYPIIEAVQMPIFFMISGYISGMKLPIDSVLEWKSTIGKRAISYLIPFFTWLLLKQWDNLAIGFRDTILQLDRGLWFLMTLFIINLILYTAQVLSKMFRKKGELIGLLGFCIIFGLISSLFVLQIALQIKGLSPELTLRYIPPFFLGYIACAYKDELLKIFNQKLQFAAFVISTIAFIYFTWIYKSNAPLNQLILLIVDGLFGSYVIFYIFLKSKKTVIKEKLAWIGQYTLEIYTIHFHFANKLNPGEIRYNLYSINGLIFAIASFALMSITTAGLVYMVNQVPIMKLLMFGKQIKKSKNVK